MLEYLRNNIKGDRVIWAVVIVLSIISLLVVYSSTGTLAYKYQKGNTEYYLIKHGMIVLFGLFLIIITHKIKFTYFSRISQIAIFFAAPLLLLTLVKGANLNEASRWLALPGTSLTFQTSDFAKLALFMFISRTLSKKQDVIKDFKKGFLPVIWPVLATCALILPANLSNALLTGATSLLLMFIGRISMKHILLVIGVALIPAIMLVSAAVITYTGKPKVDYTIPVSKLEKEKVKDKSIFVRVQTWISRIQDFIYATDAETPYQVQQAKIAIANGGVLVGLGPGNSRQRNFLPQAYNDFIYSIIIEEYGLLGGAFMIFIYLVFLFRCIRIFRRCPFAFGAFLAVGLSFTLVIQAIANMAVNVNLLPVTGVTLPLVSMGGSSYLFTCCAIGIILSVARNVEQTEGKIVDPFATPVPVPASPSNATA